jgi:hypothetical protein
MTVASENSRNEYTGNGSTTAFAYTFKILASSHVAVYVSGTLKTEVTDYTVTGVDADAGGTVTFVSAPAAAASVVLIRSVPLTQATDYEENGGFSADTHERALDKLTMIAQQITETFGRALKFAKTSTLKDIDVPEGSSASNRATKHMRWNVAGTALELVSVAVDAVTGLITTRGDLIRGSSTGAPERLALGATKKYLKSDGTDAGWDYVTAVKESGGQVLDLGAVSDGQVLMRSGTSVIGGAGSTPPTPRFFTASGTWTKPAGLQKVRVRVWGGGAGGGASSAGSPANPAGGGGGGGYSEKWIAAASLGSTETVTVGAGGAGGTGGTGAGASGNTSSLGAHCSATGGAGGSGSSAAASGGAGGSGSGGDINMTGQGGTASAADSGATAPGGTGGSAAGGGGGGGRSPFGSTGAAGSQPGGGGGSGGGPNGSNRDGGAGGAGAVIVEEYY